MNPFNSLPSSFKSKEILEAAETVIIACSKLSTYVQIKYKLTELQATHFTALLISSLPSELETNSAIKPQVLKIIKEIKETVGND